MAAAAPAMSPFYANYLPESLNYKSPQAIGMPHRIINAKFYPTGTVNNNLTTSDIVRYQISTPHFLDPFSTYLEVTVECKDSKGLIDDTITNTSYRNVNDLTNQNVMTHKCMQLDGSSFSLLSSLVIYEQNSEIERLNNLDVILNMLKDVSYGRNLRTTKDHEGLGGQIGSNFTNHVNRIQVASNAPIPPSDAESSIYNRRWDKIDTSGDGYVYPFKPVEAMNYIPQMSASQGTGKSIDAIASQYYDPLRSYTHSWLGYPDDRDKSQFDDKADDTFVKNPDSLNPKQWNLVTAAGAVPPEYDRKIDSIQARRLTDRGLRKYIGASPVVQHILYDCPNLGFETPFTITEDNVIREERYKRQGVYDKQVNDCVYPNENEYILRSQRVANVGYHNPFPANFGTTTFEPILSLQPQRCIQNGKPAVISQSSGTFYIPLPSGIFGSLMGAGNYKLIPMVAFKNLIFEFQFNPFAFFTSWSSTDINSRNYIIKKCVLHAELVEWYDLTVINATNEALASGFTICTQSYYPGPVLNMSGNNILQTVSINLGFDSLKALYFCFLDANYRNNSMYRKQYRMSGNLTSMQLKIGTDFIPQSKIEGHSGNNYGEKNCYPFYIEMLKACGKLNAGIEMAVNPHNFCINWRETYAASIFANTYPKNKWIQGFQGTQPDPAFWPDDTAEPQIALHGRTVNAPITLLDGNTYTGNVTKTGNPLYTGTYQNELNLLHYAAQVHTGSQLSFFLENRVVGKAMYGFDLDSLNFENAILSGVRTKEARPFEIMLERDTTDAFVGNLEMYVFCYYDLILNFSQGQVTSLGR